MYNLNVVPRPPIKEPLDLNQEVAVSTESSAFDFDSPTPPPKAVASSSKGYTTRSSKQAPSWLPKRAPSKVQLPLMFRFQKDHQESETKLVLLLEILILYLK